MRTVIIIRQRRTGKQIHDYTTIEDVFIEVLTYEKDE